MYFRDLRFDLFTHKVDYTAFVIFWTVFFFKEYHFNNNSVYTVKCRSKLEEQKERKSVENTTNRVEVVLPLYVMLDEHDVVQSLLKLEGVLLTRLHIAHRLIETGYDGWQPIVASHITHNATDGEAVVGRSRVVQPVAAWHSLLAMPHGLG